MKKLKLILSLALITICLFPPAVAHRLSAQTVTWTSSHPDIVSVDANGTIKMVSEPDTTTNVTITATAQQNGKTVTSSKTIQTDDCITCFTYKAAGDTQARTYCGVRLANGQCWLDRNLGASQVAVSITDTAACGMFFSRSTKTGACPTGWRLPLNTEIEQAWASALGLSTVVGLHYSEVFPAISSSILKVPSTCAASKAGGANWSCYSTTDKLGTFWVSSNCDYTGIELGSSSYQHFQTGCTSSNPHNARCVKN